MTRLGVRINREDPRLSLQCREYRGLVGRADKADARLRNLVGRRAEGHRVLEARARLDVLEAELDDARTRLLHRLRTTGEL